MNQDVIIRGTLYFLALINPASKIFLLCTYQPPISKQNLRSIAIRSTAVAFIILGLLSWAGNFLLIQVFQVELYSLRAAGGAILFLIGLSAVRQGRFYEESALSSVSDISIVPLAAPLIAGPGTITAAISFSTINGFFAGLACLSVALLINLAIMLVSGKIGTVLEKINATGPLVRITGLIVTAVAVQMFLTGLKEFIVEIGR